MKPVGDHEVLQGPGKAACDGVRAVKAYLGAVEQGDLAEAKSYMSDDFTMTFPGGVRFTRLEELVAWGKLRYRFVRKDYEVFAQGPRGEGSREEDSGQLVVTCFGTLSGEWLDGSGFGGVRFCDCFLIGGDGKLLRQEVWNDLALVMPRPR